MPDLLRTDLIVPIEWESRLVHALTIEDFGEEHLAAILKALRRRSSRKALIEAVALACECPQQLVQRLCDRDLERAADMVTKAINSKSSELLNG